MCKVIMTVSQTCHNTTTSLCTASLIDPLITEPEQKPDEVLKVRNASGHIASAKPHCVQKTFQGERKGPINRLTKNKTAFAFKLSGVNA